MHRVILLAFYYRPPCLAPLRRTCVEKLSSCLNTLGGARFRIPDQWVSVNEIELRSLQCTTKTPYNCPCQIFCGVNIFYCAYAAVQLGQFDPTCRLDVLRR